MPLRARVAGFAAVLALTLWAFWPGAEPVVRTTVETATSPRVEANSTTAGEPAPDSRLRVAAQQSRSQGSADAPQLETASILFRGKVIAPESLDPSRLFVTALRLNLPEQAQETFDLQRLNTWADVRWMRAESSTMLQSDGTFELNVRDSLRQEHRHRRYVLVVASMDHEGYPRLNNSPYLTPLGLAWGEDAQAGSVHQGITIECVRPSVIRVVADLDPRLEWARQGFFLDLSLISTSHDLSHQRAFAGAEKRWPVRELPEAGVPYSISPLGGPVSAAARLQLVSPSSSFSDDYTDLPAAQSASPVTDQLTLRVSSPPISWVYLDLGKPIPMRRGIERGDDLIGTARDVPNSIELHYERLDHDPGSEGLRTEGYPSTAQNSVLQPSFFRPDSTQPELVFRNKLATLFPGEDRTWVTVGWMEAGSWRITATLRNEEVWKSDVVQLIPGAITRVRLHQSEQALRRVKLSLPDRYLQEDCALAVVGIDQQGRIREDTALTTTETNREAQASSILQLKLPDGIAGFALLATYENVIAYHEYAASHDQLSTTIQVKQARTGLRFPELETIRESMIAAELVRLQQDGRPSGWKLPLPFDRTDFELQGLPPGTYAINYWLDSANNARFQRFQHRFVIP